MFGRYGLIQAPMAGVQDSALAVAACRAGAVGSLPAAMLDAETLAAELARIQAAVGTAKYNVNFFAHRTPQISAAQRDAWHQQLQPYFEAFGLCMADIPADGGRRPFDGAALDVVRRFRVPVVSFHFGLPEPHLLAALKACGVEIWSSATTVEEAVWLEKNGADAVIAQGLEAGGHRGMFLSPDVTRQMGLFSLLPNIVRAVSCPVIAAGGIATPEAVSAAKALGAAAVQAGTAFLLADEAKTSAAHRAALQSAQAHDTVLTNLFSGGLARGIRNRFMDEAGPVSPYALPFPAAGAAAGMLKAAAERAGSSAFSSFWAGQSAALATSGSTAEIVRYLTGGGSVI
ncbi:nitronate monooxygenase [Neisseria leonii]|uniref:NAD(P)H-dependent flavin oxidoreductase n=1 Tax=Neisseria leonii TaxID=2995413 RepID=UPI00237A9CEF|nr:nitronate monooxygenase [Neisseria sp. 3986]MDD9326010.1 nitronate monooxygenase [Neisseria sp. 3986]